MKGSAREQCHTPAVFTCTHQHRLCMSFGVKSHEDGPAWVWGSDVRRNTKSERREWRCCWPDILLSESARGAVRLRADRRAERIGLERRAAAAAAGSDGTLTVLGVKQWPGGMWGGQHVFCSNCCTCCQYPQAYTFRTTDLSRVQWRPECRCSTRVAFGGRTGSRGRWAGHVDRLTASGYCVWCCRRCISQGCAP